MASGATANSRLAPSPTVRDLARILFGRWRLLTASLLFLLLAILAVFVVTPRYEAHFKVLLRRGRSDPMISPEPASVVNFTRPEISEEELNSEAELLRDGDLLKEVVQKADLLPPKIPASALPTEAERTARKMSQHLSVETLRKSNLIQVSYRDTDPGRAARVLATLSTVYMQRHTALHRPSGEIDFFEQQTADSEKRLRQSETELVRFTRSRGIVAAELERDIALQKLGEAEAAHRGTEQDLAETEKNIAALHDQVASFPTRSVTLKRWADNPMLLEKLKSHMLELQLKRTGLLTRYEPSYRLVQEVDRQIEETRAAIAGEALTPVRDESTDKDPNYEWARMELEKSEVRASGLRAREADAFRQIVFLRTRTQQMQSDAVDQRTLMRAAKAEEDNYLLYLRKREEARIGDALDARRILNVAIIEPPDVPTLPVHSILFYFLLSFGAALSFSIVVAFTAEYLDPTIRSPEEAREVLELPVLGWLPERKRHLGVAASLRTRGSQAVVP
jgi:uncharacterized protein involved in exopolysaccharide biosynthesis